MRQIAKQAVENIIVPISVLGNGTLKTFQFDKENYCIELELDGRNATEIIGFVVDKDYQITELNGALHTWTISHENFLKKHGFHCAAKHKRDMYAMAAA